MKIKEGVILSESSAIPIALQIIEPILKKHGQELVITSMMDGQHMTGSKHYEGQAVDLRIWDLHHKDSCVSKMRTALGENYDVVLESDHIHLEYDPK